MYSHGGDVYSHSGIELDFSANLNPLGMPAEVRAAVAANAGSYDIYPDPLCRRLAKAIAESENVPQEHILCGNGAADLIFKLFYAAKPKRALVCAPTFSEYEKAAKAAGAVMEYHYLSTDNGFRLTDAILDDLHEGIDIAVLCNPNNPTGVLADDALMRCIAEHCQKRGILLLVDECFLCFTDGKSIKPLLAGNPNLCILQAFTKLYAMAGLRLGYMLSGNAAMLESVNGAGQCWSVSAPAQVAGLAALGCEGWRQRTRKLVDAERGYMANALRGLGIEVFESSANYLLLRCELPLYDMLLQRGILIRRCNNYICLDDRYYRIGLKPRRQNDILLDALREVLNG